MSYWKYRAYDAQLRIQEGVLISPTDDEYAPDGVILQLRQQGLQGIELRQIDRAEYLREEYLRKLKARGRPKPQQVNPPTAGTHPSIRRRMWRAFRSLWSR